MQLVFPVVLQFNLEYWMREREGAIQWLDIIRIQLMLQLNVRIIVLLVRRILLVLVVLLGMLLMVLLVLDVLLIAILVIWIVLAWGAVSLLIIGIWSMEDVLLCLGTMKLEFKLLLSVLGHASLAHQVQFAQLVGAKLLQLELWAGDGVLLSLGTLRTVRELQDLVQVIVQLALQGLTAQLVKMDMNWLRTTVRKKGQRIWQLYGQFWEYWELEQ